MVCSTRKYYWEVVAEARKEMRTCTVSRRSGVAGVSSKSNLIVNNNVNSSVGRVVGQVRQMESFIDDTLASKSGVSVNQH